MTSHLQNYLANVLKNLAKAETRQETRCLEHVQQQGKNDPSDSHFALAVAPIMHKKGKLLQPWSVFSSLPDSTCDIHLCSNKAEQERSGLRRN